MKNSSISIVHILRERGLLNTNQVELLSNSQNINSIIRHLIENMYVTEEQIISIVNEHYHIPYIDLDHISIDLNLANYIPYSVARDYMVIPFHQEGETLYVAMEDPLNVDVLDELKVMSNMHIKPFICQRKKINRAIILLYRDVNVRNAISDYKKELTTLSARLSIRDNLDYDLESSPIVRFFDTILAYAVAENASDIHIEPFENNCRIRFRIDGELYTIMEIPIDIYEALISRIKILGQLDIAESREPQDGRFIATIVQADIDIRISTIPTIYGEKVALRILNKSRYFLTKDKLGLTYRQMQDLTILLANPNGIILATGPTGSGKTTTLYSILHELNKENKNIVTIEDPVEYTIHGINQIQVNSKIGFANGLRTTLRQDPDIIMLGEIRDKKTASIAIRAAITGHLVLSTLHTDSAVGAITRLIDMGVEQFLLAPSIVGIISQRLVRVLCSKCKEKTRVTIWDDQILENIGDHNVGEFLYSPVGCNLCNFTGYKGRTGVFEILVITDEIRQVLAKGHTQQTLIDIAIQSGMQPIQNQCLSLLTEGITDITEVLKVVYSNDLMYTEGGRYYI